MSPALRRLIYASLGLLWLTGCAWLVLHVFFHRTTEFGTTPHPWQPRLLTLHGMVAVLAVFLFGWISSMHIGARWRRGTKRASGIVLLAVGAVLILAGFSNYYFTSESLLSGASVVHETLGVLAILPMLVHCLGRRRNGNGNGNGNGDQNGSRRTLAEP